MSTVVQFPGVTKADLPPPYVLEAAPGEELEHVVVVGCREDGSLYFASSAGDSHETLALLARATTWLCNRVDGADQ